MFLWCQDIIACQDIISLLAIIANRYYIAKNSETSYGSKNHTVLISAVLSVGANSLLYNICKLQ